MKDAVVDVEHTPDDQTRTDERFCTTRETSPAVLLQRRPLACQADRFLGDFPLGP